MLQKIVSGGQTGVDRAALDVGLLLGIPIGGWCPKGRLAYDGPISEKYPLKETPTADYLQRTEWNVRDSDATLIITWGEPTGGTGFTKTCAVKLKKPFLVINLQKLSQPQAVDEIHSWFNRTPITTLNIAGPRESEAKNIYNHAHALLMQALQSME